MRKLYNRILITAALPYANGKIHLGHLAGAYLPADIYARYQRAQKRDVVFICGSDEHGVPITITAENEKTTPRVIVDRYHELNKKAFEKFGMSFDNYSRTSSQLHHLTAQEFFLKLYNAGILVEKKEKQLYDEKAKMFLPDRYVEGTCPKCSADDARGDQCEKCGTYLNPNELLNPRSKITGDTPVVKETSHWYFPLGKYQKRLEEYIQQKNAEDTWKDNVLKYCQTWFNEGLQDRAVTRDLHWGVPVPIKGYENKVLYVWFDAVLGYISATIEWSKINNHQRWKDFWLKEDTKYVAFIGKDNVVFHCIVFPAMIMAWNDNSDEKYILPTNVPANEFLNLEGQKFSKSRGWGVDVDEFLEKYPADSLRYALTINLPETRDSDFYWNDFQARHNNELANILGNFVNRTITFVHKNFKGQVPKAEVYTDLDKRFINDLKNAPNIIAELIESYRFREAALEMMNLARISNKYFNDSEPWITIKNNINSCATSINLCLHAVKAMAILFEPVLPFTSKKILNMLNLDTNYCWSDAGSLDLPAGKIIGNPEVLFNKIEDSVIKSEINKLKSVNDMENEITLQKPKISIEEFKKIELKVAKVLECEKVPKSDKLLKMKIRVGNEIRQLVAGIAQHVQPENLINKKIIVVTNLQNAKIMGIESEGMMLAATDSKGNLVYVTTSSDIDDGSIVK